MSALLDSLLSAPKLAECIAADAALGHTIAAAVRPRIPVVSQRWVKRCELGPLPVDVHFRPICNGVDAEITGIVIYGCEPIEPSEFSPATVNVWRTQIENDLQRQYDDMRAGC